MRVYLITSGLCLSLLAGCATVSESRFNPLNWFGKSQSVATVDSQNQQIVLPSLAPRKGYSEFVDIRPLAPSISELSVKKSASGAIVVAGTTLPSLGYFDAQLVPVDDGNSSTLSFDFKIRPPEQAAPTGSAAQRQISVAYSLSNAELSGVRTIIVRSANGARQVRR